MSPKEEYSGLTYEILVAAATFIFYQSGIVDSKMSKPAVIAHPDRSAHIVNVSHRMKRPNKPR